MLKSTLEQILHDQEAYFGDSEKIIRRDLDQLITLDIPRAVIISGVRRSGKSTLIRNLLKKYKNQAGYLHFDDPRLNQFTVDDFYTLEAIWHDKEYYQFDEVHRVQGWEQYVRHCIERKKRVAITGSNAYLLSKELGTLLTGQHNTYELFPFSLTEFCDFYNLQPGYKAFEKYFESGGFPEIHQYNIPGYHTELLNDILLRDIAVRNQIKNVRDLQQVALHLINHIGRLFSYAAIARNYQIKSVKSVSDYIDMLKDGYMFFQIPRFDFSYKKQQNNPKKAYVIDHAFARANSTGLHADYGRLLENMVFISLRKSDANIWYFNQQGACDFVLKNKLNDDYNLLQTCWELNTQNQDREINGILEAMEFFRVNQGKIITANQQDTITTKGCTIEVLPYWKWATEEL